MPTSSTAVAKSGPHVAAAPAVRTVFIEQLSLLIGKSPKTIRTFLSKEQYKHLVPRPFKLPHSRRLCWYEHEVLAWIDSHRPASPPPEKRRRGAPTKVERLERQRWAATQASAR